MKRYAAARKWRVEALEHKDCTASALREVLARVKPIGCAAECWCPATALPPKLFGRVPVVYFSPPDGPKWRNANRVECDQKAVAQMAFAELSSSNPSAYAAVSLWKTPWALKRIDSFRECCRRAGASCEVSYFPTSVGESLEDRVERMVPWASALPRHCAVFAVNDLCAAIGARAIASAGRSFPRTVTLIGAGGDDPAPKDREIAGMVSSVRLDFEMAGYLAAKRIGETTENVRSNPNDSVFPPLLVERRKSTRGNGRRDPHILEAMEMIRREACDGLTAETLVSRFPWSRQHFALRFREAAGHTILDEILNVRIARAVELLTHSEKPVSAIADFCGFRTELAFWKTFRRRMGVAPQQFRKTRR